VGLSLFALFHFLVYLLSSLKQASKRASCWVLSFKEGNLIFPYLLLVGVFWVFPQAFCFVLFRVQYFGFVFCVSNQDPSREEGLGVVEWGLCIFDKP
jgi:hypothetical protein